MRGDGWEMATEELDIIGFRGCNVAASACSSIFLNGFGPKELTSEGYGMAPGMVRYRAESDPMTQIENPRAGDVHPDTAHCLTPSIDNAALFPNDAGIINTMIFICYVERGFNTYEYQQMHSWELITQSEEIMGPNYVFGSPERMRALTWPLFAMEFATVRIPGKHVLGAFSCTRTWVSADWQDGGTYRLHPTLYWNALHRDQVGGGLSLGRIAAVKRAVLKRLAFRQNGVIPATPH